MHSIGPLELIIFAILVILAFYFRGAVLGALLGGIVGFLIRPSAPVVGQLPFEIVITRGSDLRGLNAVLQPTAEQSFNTMMAAAIIGAIGGGVLGSMTRKPSPAVPTVATSTAVPMPSTVAAKAPDLQVNKFCTKCGAAIGDEVVFCGVCGTKRG